MAGAKSSAADQKTLGAPYRTSSNMSCKKPSGSRDGPRASVSKDSTSLLNRTMVHVLPSSRLEATGLISSTRIEGAADQRSQRSASCDERHSAAPFSVNESDLQHENGAIDSAHASIADWVDLIDTSRMMRIGEVNISALVQQRDIVGLDFDDQGELIAA